MTLLRLANKVGNQLRVDRRPPPSSCQTEPVRIPARSTKRIEDIERRR